MDTSMLYYLIISVGIHGMQTFILELGVTECINLKQRSK